MVREKLNHQFSGKSVSLSVRVWLKQSILLVSRERWDGGAYKTVVLVEHGASIACFADCRKTKLANIFPCY